MRLRCPIVLVVFALYLLFILQITFCVHQGLKPQSVGSTFGTTKVVP